MSCARDACLRVQEGKGRFGIQGDWNESPGAVRWAPLLSDQLPYAGAVDVLTLAPEVGTVVALEQGKDSARCFIFQPAAAKVVRKTPVIRTRIRCRHRAPSVHRAQADQPDQRITVNDGSQKRCSINSYA